MQDDQQNFPLAAVAINITKMVMDELTAGSLSSIIGSDNKEAFAGLSSRQVMQSNTAASGHAKRVAAGGLGGYGARAIVFGFCQCAP